MQPLVVLGPTAVPSTIPPKIPASLTPSGVSARVSFFLMALGSGLGSFFKLAKCQTYSSLLDFKQLVSKNDLIVRREACRVGLLFGGFTGSYHVLQCLLRKNKMPLNVDLSGSIAGLSILALDDSSRRQTLALYLLARLAQCASNSAKSKDEFHLWGSHWGHGHSFLFACDHCLEL